VSAALDRFVKVLGGGPSGAGVKVHCPGHNDPDPSLSISETNGKILFHCFAGCSQEAVLAALKERGLWPLENGQRPAGNDDTESSKEKPPSWITPIPPEREAEVHAAARAPWTSGKWGELAGSWDYRNAAGQLLYIRARYNEAEGGKKQIIPWALAAEGPRAGDPFKGKLAPLYNLPALAAAPADAPILLVEGERCADVAAAYMQEAGLPHVALTWPGGCKAAGKVDWSVLKNRRVILWPDRDKPGIEAMQEIKNRLQALACRVTVLEPPAQLGEGGDIADLNQEGWTAAQVADFLRSGDFLHAAVSFRERQLADIPPRTWYIDGLICPGFIMVVGKKAMRKSWFMGQGANSIADGVDFLGRKATQAKVLYISFELDESDTHDRWKAMPPLSENAFAIHSWPSGEEAFEAAERAIREYGYRVLMFDTFLPMLPKDPYFKLNEYADSDFYLKWRLLGKRNNAAIVASWHTGKNDREDFFLNPIGSTGMVAQADCLISIDGKRGDPTGRVYVGGNHGKDAVIGFVFENGIFKLGETEISADRLTPDEEKTLSILSQNPGGCTAAAVGLAMGKSDNAARMALNRLMARGKVSKLKRGLYGLTTLL